MKTLVIYMEKTAFNFCNRISAQDKFRYTIFLCPFGHLDKRRSASQTKIKL